MVTPTPLSHLRPESWLMSFRVSSRKLSLEDSSQLSATVKEWHYNMPTWTRYRASWFKNTRPVWNLKKPPSQMGLCRGSVNRRCSFRNTSVLSPFSWSLSMNVSYNSKISLLFPSVEALVWCRTVDLVPLLPRQPTPSDRLCVLETFPESPLISLSLMFHFQTSKSGSSLQSLIIPTTMR